MRALVDRARVEQVIGAFARSAEDGTRVYLVGGATAIYEGWRASTVDIDFVVRPESDDFLRQLPELKERLEVNLELASPLDFIPVPVGWEDRSPLIRQIGRVAFHHFDPYSQVLAKIERGHQQDLLDAREMVNRGMVEVERLRAHFNAIEPLLFRFPAVDPPTFRRAVEYFLREP